MRPCLVAALVLAGCAPSAAALARRPADWPAAADVLEIADRGQFVELGAHAVAGKITVFDFYAVWCKPCRKVDAHLRTVAGARTDVAVRQLDVVDWDTPLARHYLADVPALPYVVVYDGRGRYLGAIAGLDLVALDGLLEASPPS
jgi:thiol-disulfide isomerase/thioredoxin